MRTAQGTRTIRHTIDFRYTLTIRDSPMKQSTMIALFELENKENKEIQSFSETPAPVHKPKEVTEAEDEIKDEEKENKEDDQKYREEHNDDEDATEDDFGDTSSENEISQDLNATDEDDAQANDSTAQMFANMTTYDILRTRMIRLEYGTQAGDGDNSCIGCSVGTADAADAVIIDSEVDSAEPTEDGAETSWGGEGGGSGGGDFGGDSGGGDDGLAFYHEFGLEGYEPMFQDAASLNYRTSFVRSFIRDVLSVGAHITKGVISSVKAAIPYVAKCFNFVKAYAKRAAKCLMTTKQLAKFYRWKLRKYISYIDVNKLKAAKVEATAGKVWLLASDICANIAKLLDSVDDSVIADKAKFIKLNKAVTAEFKKIGVNLAGDDRERLVGFLKARKAASVYQLGYTPDNIVNYFKHLEYIGEITSNTRIASLKELISKLGSSIKKLVSSDKEGANVWSARCNYILGCNDTLMMVCNVLVDDLSHVAAVYERYMDISKGDDEQDRADGMGSDAKDNAEHDD